MTRFVRCIDNTLAKDVLKVGKVYEVLQVKKRDGYYVLPSGQFTMARFQPVSAADALAQSKPDTVKDSTPVP